jgi:hypothetical protein
MLVEEFGQFGELVSAEGVVVILVEAVEELLNHFGRRAGGAVMKAVRAAIFPFSFAVFFAWSALSIGPALRAATAKPLAHGLAGLLALVVVELSVAVLVELLQHSLPPFFAARAVASLVAAFRRLGNGRKRQQPRDCQHPSGNKVPHVCHLAC